jgi:phage gpG-like protein
MAGMSDLIARMQRLSAADVHQRVGTAIANTCHAQAIEGFRGQRDPYGTPWAPRKKVKGWAALAFGHIDDGHRLLDDTGAMINSLTARYSGGRVLMRIKGYAQFHQTGTRNMVARKIFPEEARGLGTWAQPIQDAATNAVRELLK